ncbi:hypothetical protein MARBORIA2_02110 [Methanobrevibacter arboriphilus]|jgi:DNA-binding HxlR family transcriptional regulator|uniref:hypothetical protein n=1 Tax=Methanobrevibacter arboriphilus TaxID=39441 RepID=UPI0022EEBAFD|nr:hypothetical protein [Methanobrevibacter arboriphilus]GLI11121.1 hypothetical protein MARBORIA2_02110 [Methanobrevibacter arboriphilus]
MDIKKEFYKEISFLKAGKYRILVISDINNKFKTPTDISKSLKIPMRETSRALKELRDHKMVEVLDDDVKKGRLYKLTSKGFEALEILKNNT